MRAEFENALEFLQTAQSIADVDALVARFGEAAGPFGFTKFQCAHVAAPGEPVRPRLLFGPAINWGQRYLDQQMYRRDPTIQTLFSSIDAFTWSEVEARTDKAGKAVFEAARAFGYAEGLVVPLHGAFGEVCCVIMVSEAPDFDPAARPILATMARMYATVGLPLVEVRQDEAGPVLTKRESECLTWVLRGKTDWEIGRIIGISHRTVEMHIDNAKRKLEVRNRTQAVVLALQRGLLIADD